MNIIINKMQHNIGCVILSNTDDLRFLQSGLKEIVPIFKYIVVAMGSKLWNGTEENIEKMKVFIDEINKKYNNIQCIVYKIPEDKDNNMIKYVSSEMYWEGHARYISLTDSIKSCEYVVFLDSDEIIDGQKFKEWLDTGLYKKYEALKLQNYWYWREPIYRAKNYFEDSVVMMKNGSYDPRHLFSNMGRHGVFASCIGSRRRDVTSIDDEPMIHHYSWVRNHYEMLRKVQSWGHRNDRLDWIAMVDEEFSRNFNGTDFLKHLEYDIVDNRFDIK